MFEIENRVPISKRIFGHRKSKYPWMQMKVGDSFFIPDREDKKVRYVCPSILRGKSGNFYKFCQRRVEGGIRIWRIK